MTQKSQDGNKFHWDTFINKLICTLIIMVPAIYFGFFGQTVEMGLAIVASSIACSFMNLDKIENFKGAGFEAKMRKAVNEAYITIDMLKKTSIPLLLSSLNSITWGKRLGTGIDIKKEHQMKGQIEEIVRVLNIENDDINRLFSDFTRLQTLDLWREFIKSIKDPDKGEIISKIDNLYNSEIGKFPDKNEINEALKLNGVHLNHDNEIALNAYLYYLEHKELKN